MRSRIKALAGRALLKTRLRGLVLDQLRDEGLLLCGHYGKRTFAFLPGDFIGDCLARDGEYQRDLVVKAFDILERERKLQSPLKILEIGSNIGTQTNYFCELANVESVICVEPHPQNLKILRLDLRLNELQARAIIMPYAASSIEGQIQFARYRYNMGRCAVVNESVDLSAHETMVVQSFTATEIVRKAGWSLRDVGFIWIDVEEHEIHVLKGMPELIGVPMVLEFSRHAMSQQDFSWFVAEVLPSYSRMRAYEEDFQDITPQQLDVRTSQYNLLLT